MLNSPNLHIRHTKDVSKISNHTSKSHKSNHSAIEFNSSAIRIHDFKSKHASIQTLNKQFILLYSSLLPRQHQRTPNQHLHHQKLQSQNTKPKQNSTTSCARKCPDSLAMVASQASSMKTANPLPWSAVSRVTCSDTSDVCCTTLDVPSLRHELQTAMVIIGEAQLSKFIRPFVVW